MTDDISKLATQTSDEVTKTLIVEVVKKVSIEDGDILIVKVASEEVFTQLQSILAVHNPDKKFLLINQQYADILAEAGEEMMKELGWVRDSPRAFSSDDIEAIGQV